jgi:hypothetical protein
MKIGIITIATGKYSRYIQELVETSEDLFLCGHDRKYFVYTDCDIEQLGNFKGSEKIIKIHQDKLGWPYDSMMRFHMFNRVRTEVLKNDYTFFFNVNLNFVDQISDEVLPNKENDYLVGVSHPGYHQTPIDHLPFERNPVSSFFIPFGKGRNYFQGCFNGGKTEQFMEMSEELELKLNSDLQKKHIPIWHDESALNWYLNQRNPLTLPPSYAHPEKCEPQTVIKAIQIDKKDHGGHDFLRN